MTQSLARGRHQTAMHVLLLLSLVFMDVSPTPLHFSRTRVALPGAKGSVALDYMAADRESGHVWIPAGETGSVDVLDVASRRVTGIEGFRTRAAGNHAAGPSAVALGAGKAFIGNRASRELCVADAIRLVKLGCMQLAVWPDGVEYASTGEVWVTAPGDRSIAVIDAHGSRFGGKTVRISLAGQPEGYAVDVARGRFFTNLEDRNETLTIDVRTHEITSTWSIPCGEDGPRGLAYDHARQFLFVACTDKVVVLDAGHGGAQLGTLAAGPGVDNIDYLDSQANLYVAAGRAARMTVGHVDDKGTIRLIATVPTESGARAVVVAADGTAVVADPHHGAVLVFSPEH